MKNIKIKNFLIILTALAMVLFLTGCLDYKAYYSNNKLGEEKDLANEIAEIEKELGEIGIEKETGENLTGEIAEEETAIEEIIVSPEEEVNLSQLQKIVVKENELVNLAVKIEDPDKDKINYSFSPPLDKKGKWKTKYGDAGEYVITITATDGLHEVKKDILLVVERVNVPPVIKKIKDIFIKEGERVTLEPEVTDPNGDPVTVTISEPLDKGSWKTDHTSAGEYEITVTASDGELENKETFLLVVKDVNVPPEIKGLKDIVIKEGETVELKPEITDLDGDPVNITISEPVGNDGIWETSYTDHGFYEITITADDGKDKVTKKITITVEDVNMPPEIVEIKLV